MTILKMPCDCRASTLIVSGIDGYKCRKCGAYVSFSSEKKRLQKERESSDKIAELEHELAICIDALREIERSEDMYEGLPYQIATCTLAKLEEK